MINNLWTEKYRPKTAEEYVFKDAAQKRQVLAWIKDKSIPHLLFSGTAGIGKTTLAKILINELGIEEYDVLEINASRTNSVDDVRNKIINFVQMIPFGPFKVVLLDEADYLSPNAQAALRGVMEEYHQSSRFILTCNYANKIIPALHSRCQGFHFEKIDQTEFTARVATVLVNEQIDFDLDTLDTYVKITYPDLRKCLNTLQQHISDDQKLTAPTTTDDQSLDVKIAMVELFKQDKIREARTLVCSKIRTEEIQEIFTWLYHNIDLFDYNDDQEDKALLEIKQGLVDHTLVADPEINLAATMVRLANIKKETA